MRMMKRLATGLAMLLTLTSVGLAQDSSTRSGEGSPTFGEALMALLAPQQAGFAGAGRQTSAATDVTFDAAWLASQPVASGDADFTCLTKAIYFEARGETPKGQAAVAEVILNRVDSGEFARTVCGVVEQSNSNGCQFSFVCDGLKDRVREPAAWDRSAKIARAMLDGAERNLTDGATYFHTPSVRPDWSRRFEKTARIGQHLFYRAPIRTAMN